MRRRIATIATVLLLGLALPALARSQAATDLTITGVDPTEYPEITVSFALHDANGRAVPNVQPADLLITDGSLPTEVLGVEPQQVDPMAVVYLIDLGRYANYQLFGEDALRAALGALAESDAFTPGVDTVEVLGRQGALQGEQNITLLEATTDETEFRAFLEEQPFLPTAGPTQVLEGVAEAVERADDLAGENGAGAVVLVTPVVDTLTVPEAIAAAEEVGAEAQARGVPVYVLHTQLSGNFADPLQTLADASGGGYLLLDPANPTPPELTAIFDALSQARVSYTARYRTAAAEAGERDFTLAVTAGGGTASADGTYTVPFEPPTVAVVTPEDGQTFALPGDAFDEDGQPVTPQPVVVPVIAEIDGWPDGEPRGIAQAALLVDGAVAQSITPDASDNRFEFTWPVDPGTAADAHTLTVQVRDEMGFSGESAPVEIVLEAPPPAPEPEPTPTVGGCFATPFAPECAQATAGIGALLGFAAVLGGAYVWHQRMGTAPAPVSPPIPAIRTQPQPQAAAETPAPTATTPIPGEVPPARPELETPPLAWLKVERGPADLTGRELPMVEAITRLGTRPEDCEIAFYEGQRSTLSKHHATLQHYRGAFFLTDQRSRSGTRVGDQALVPGRPLRLTGGERITLGNGDGQSVILTFEPVPQTTDNTPPDADS